MAQHRPRIQSQWVLKRSIPGMEAPFVAGPSRAGALLNLPVGAQLLVCGVGFDEHTVKVLWNDKYYFVYTERLTDAGTAPLSAAIDAR